MRFHLAKTPNGMRSPTLEDGEKLAAVAMGDIIACSYTKTRNAKLFRKFHAMLNMIAANHPRLDTLAEVKLELKIKCGHYDEHITGDGEIVYVPRSIAYDELDGAEFEVFYGRALKIASTEFVQAMTPERLDSYLDEISMFGDY